MSDAPFPYRTSDGRVIPWLLVGLAAIFGALYVAGYWFTSDRIPRGTTVEGVLIGGLSPGAAEVRLADGLRQRATDPITVVANDARVSLDPAKAGLSVDLGATVAAAGAGRSWDPVRMWEYFAGGTAEDAVVTVDHGALDAAVARVAAKADQPAREGAVRFAAGEAVATYPEKGTVVDRPAAAAVVRAAFLHGTADVDLPTAEADPVVSADAVSRAMDGFANPAMSGAVDVTLAGRTVRLQPEEFSAALSMQAEGAELQPRLDGDALLAVVRPALEQLAPKPGDAPTPTLDGKPVAVPATTGVTFDPADVTSRFLGVLTSIGADRRLELTSVALPPQVTAP